jgi:hypothetical protein
MGMTATTERIMWTGSRRVLSKGTDLYLSVSSRDTVPPNPYRR